MSQLGLEALLKPKSIAVIGASQKVGRAGHLMMKNLLAGGFSGAILPVNPNYSAVCGVMAYPTISALPVVPDLAILCTHARHLAQLLDDLGEKGCRSCIILSASKEHFAELLARASRWNMRLLGPNSLGLIAPHQGLNASFSPVPVARGNVAFIAQSTAVANTILDWAQQRKIGFSWFIALGDGVDIDSDDLLDFLARDTKTHAILIALEHLNDARRFVSAARSASRNKPIVMFKSGRSRAARLLVGSEETFDGTWDAAIQRAGMLRVYDSHELFSAVESLSHMRHFKGESLFIVSNGVAPAALALDVLEERQGTLLQLSPSTALRLRERLPDNIPVTNPLDLKDDATTQLYLDVTAILLDSPEAEAIMVIHAPSAVSPASECAEQLAKLYTQHPRAKYKTLLTNWCGEYSSLGARAIFSQARIPTWRTPEGTVTAFMHRVAYHRNQKQLRETPARLAVQPLGRTDVRKYLQQQVVNGSSSIRGTVLDRVLAGYGFLQPERAIEGVQEQDRQRIRIVVQLDPLFGPIILVGEPSEMWHEDRQAVTSLLPLNMALANHLIAQGIQQQKMFRRWKIRSETIYQLSQLLVQLSDLIIDCPEISTCQLDLFVGKQTPLLLIDGQLSLQPFVGDSEDRLAIRPYPQKYEQWVSLKDGQQALFRPILPEDEPQLLAFIGQVTKEDLYYRYFSEINEFTHDDLANMTQIDYDREMAFVAVIQENGIDTIIGVTRAISDSDNIDAEFSILVRSDLKRLGLGKMLLEKMISYTRDHGLKQLNGITMPNNTGMIALAKQLGFHCKNSVEDGIVSLRLALKSPIENSHF
ncbi:bifunctional acetate--CoA ligase family protein/GNAT family N-acetyltransferase [Rosenbergiella nectarea]|uniref:bifunctional acetate--CoA ligase family protein/GNAT family N-acetyltransferase n=1 Tax=Rosenbergiella nectarea TaxID=988801 RepID=UPI001BDA4276|nr:bifunctional acetate--CoA ligase family protein/GNAT family N-acetyltransferase [Rosenbergiella nectarea]MBT0731359.1 bifunctional acetate--CoA ligase family protein/GNAT family N-acetyltransferase [Rosenbergiella nectarea subsp. apis]